MRQIVYDSFIITVSYGKIFVLRPLSILSRILARIPFSHGRCTQCLFSEGIPFSHSFRFVWSSMDLVFRSIDAVPRLTVWMRYSPVWMRDYDSRSGKAEFGRFLSPAFLLALRVLARTSGKPILFLSAFKLGLTDTRRPLSYRVFLARPCALPFPAPIGQIESFIHLARLEVSFLNLTPMFLDIIFYDKIFFHKI